MPVKNGRVLDDFRIKKAIPTVKFLEKKGAKVILITHLGKNGTKSLKPVIRHFFKISKCPKSRISFFDNVRKFSGETRNDKNFAKKLSKLGDIYVNDAFSVSHRTHASIVLLPKLLPGYAGFQLEEEIKNLSHAFKKIRHPFLFILGGAKFSTKMPLIRKYLKLADWVFIGGALADDFLKAEGYEIGKSLTDKNNYGIKKFLDSKKLMLPSDVVVSSGKNMRNRKIKEIKKDEIILDIGKESIRKIGFHIKKSKLILLNGPLGKYEEKGGVATKKILKLIADSGAESIIGGGDTVALVSSMKIGNKFTFVSTGGGATLDFLANGTLPGIKALK